MQEKPPDMSGNWIITTTGLSVPEHYARFSRGVIFTAPVANNINNQCLGLGFWEFGSVEDNILGRLVQTNINRETGDRIRDRVVEFSATIALDELTGFGTSAIYAPRSGLDEIPVALTLVPIILHGKRRAHHVEIVDPPR